MQESTNNFISKWNKNQCFSLSISISLFLPLSLQKINNFFKKCKKEIDAKPIINVNIAQSGQLTIEEEKINKNDYIKDT